MARKEGQKTRDEGRLTNDEGRKTKDGIVLRGVSATTPMSRGFRSVVQYELND
jgi:hypothetical protein